MVRILDKRTDKPSRGRPRTFDRDRTLDVALESYWCEGPSGMSLNEVCRRAEVSKPGLYRAFGNEDGLTDAVLTRYTERMLGPVMEMIADDRPFGDVLDTLVNFMTTRPDSGPAGCLLAKMRSSLAQLGPVTRAHVERLHANSVAAYVRWVDHARYRGEIGLSIDTDLAAAFIDAQFNNILAQMATGEDPAMVRAQAQLAFAGLTGRECVGIPGFPSQGPSGILDN